MNSRKIKLIALFVAMFFSISTAAFAENECGTPIYLYYNNAPRIDGIRRPHRAPSATHLSLEVSFDEVTSKLVFNDNQAQIYYYTITDENNSTVSEGNLDFKNQECINVILDLMIPGTYTLTVIHEGNEFTGSFEIE